MGDAVPPAGWRADLGWAAVALAGSAAFASASLVLPWGRDQGIYAHAAWRTLHGHLPYAETFIFKPPGTLGVHVLSQVLFGPEMWAIRAMDVLWTMATALVVFGVARTATRSPGLGSAAAVLWAWQSHRLGYWNLAQTDGWGNLPLGIALLAVLSPGSHRQRTVLAGVAGLALAGALWLKYPLAALLPVVALVPLLRQGRDGLQAAGAVVGGFAAGVGGMVLGLAAVGAWDDLLMIQQEIVAPYAGLAAEGLARRATFPEHLEKLPEYFGWWSVGAWIAGAVVALGVPAVRAFRRERPVLREAELAALGALAWLGVGFLSGWMQGKAWEYQLQALSGGASVLAVLAPGLVRTGVLLLPWPWLRWAGLPLGLGLLWMAGTDRPYPARWGELVDVATGERTLDEVWRNNPRYANKGTSLHHNRELAAWLVEHTDPDDAVFLWGYDPMVYVLSGRDHPTRFPYTYPAIVPWAEPHWRDELLADLEEDPPEVFVVATKDSVSVVTGVKKHSDELLAEWPELASFVAQNYAPGPRIRRFTVHLPRQDAPGPVGSR